MFNIIKLNALDNVGVAPMNIPLGAKINSQLNAETQIPFGHKISLKNIKKDELIYKYGQIIGIATEQIKKGSHVHSHNLAFHEFSRSFKKNKTSKINKYINDKYFKGFKRQNGNFGTRNYIGLISTVNCSATVVKKIADKLNKYLSENNFHSIDGAVCLKHSSGCGMNNTSYGRKLYAIGGNAEVARLAGYNIKLIKLSAFIICSVLSSISAILLASRIGSANHVAGDLFEFQVVAAVVLGGVSLVGGIGTLTGAALGVLILAVISNGLGMLNVESQWQMVVNGIIIILAVGFDEIKRRKN